MSSITISADYGYVLIVGVALYLLQQLVLVIPVAKARGSTKIKAPVLYPNDSLIKDLKLSPEQVQNYLCAQRAHQNNVEVMSVFMPLFLAIGLFEPIHVASSGAILCSFRFIGQLGFV